MVRKVQFLCANYYIVSKKMHVYYCLTKNRISTKMDDEEENSTYKNVYCILLIYKKRTLNSCIRFQRNSHISFHRRSLRWYKTFFFALLSLHVIYMWINSIVIYLESSTTKVLVVFRTFIVDFQDFFQTFFQYSLSFNT